MSTREPPVRIENSEQLERILSEPSEAAIRAMQRLDGDLMLIGAGGKMGPSLARMVIRADEANGKRRKVYAVSRFSNQALPELFRANGVLPIAGDMLDAGFVNDLPDAPNLIHMTGFKFGASASPSMTWAVNTLIPNSVCQKFKHSKIVTFSTGNVYPLVPIDSGGCCETDSVGPVGEYAMSALGRERLFEYFSMQFRLPMTVLRLNYAVEMRYGVLVDLALKVLHGQSIDLTMAHVNVIWQGDANAMALASFDQTTVPASILNLAGPEILRVKEVCLRFGRRFGKSPRFEGSESNRALLNNGLLGHERYGKPRINADQLIDWTGDWISRGGATLGKPTRFEVRNGQF